MYNYNSDANEKMLRADGYLPDGEVTVTASAPSTHVGAESGSGGRGYHLEVITILNINLG